MIMFPGALRFFPIRRKVMEGWESGCFLDELGERALLVSWKDITVSLIKWNETRRWEPLILTAVTSLYKIESAEDALRVGDLLFIPLRYGF
ncbi:hypothetical protein HU200_045125 [Digitaria exilis]|uniref:Uncharacterized protein n=1 Tax=Digitaria exilis TaxID=1010633 RepID=A0A835B0Z4_9POAL|nr:hypothetical protein HU200_045125 [Digitaria exilis]